MKRPTENLTASHALLKRFLNVSILAIISVLSAVSCASRRPIQAVEIVRTEREIIRDTNILIEPDSASVKALFECDSLNHVVMKEMAELRGNRLTPSLTTSHKENGTMLARFDCKEDSLQLEIQRRDRIIEELRATVQTVEVEKPLNKWDSFCVVCGYIFMGLLALLIILFIVKLFIR